MIYGVKIGQNTVETPKSVQSGISENPIEFKDFFEEFLKELFKNIEIDENGCVLFVSPFLVQDLANKSANLLSSILKDVNGSYFSDENNITQKVKINLSEFLHKIDKILSENVKAKNEIVQKFNFLDNFENNFTQLKDLGVSIRIYLPDNFISDFLTDLEKLKVKNIFISQASKPKILDTKQSILTGDEHIINSDSLDLLNQNNEILNNQKIISSEDLKSEALKLINEKSIKSKIETINKSLSELNLEIVNPESEEITKKYISTSQSITNSELTTKNNSHLQQKILDLPVIRLSQISETILKALSSSQKTLIVQLEPPELGKIMIKLSMDSLGVRADMKVDYPHVKEMIAGLIPEIKNTLQSSGIRVSDFLLDLMRDHRGYQDSPSGQGQKRYRGSQRFFEYIA